VSDKPSTFLDIHGRFGVSREVIESFVRHGLLKEIWGPEHIGVRFSLTAKGKRFLKELESAANFKPPRREKLIALKREILP
jgi:DNA-binding PadR family transcriptional regulator